MNHFWLTRLESFGFKTQLCAFGEGIDRYLPKMLQGDVNLQSRAMVVKRLPMVPVEFIARSVLTGSAVKSYQQTGEVCGHKLPAGLRDGDALPCILDTPTTKAEEGHDENLSAQEVRGKYPLQTYNLIQAFQIASSHAKDCGIKLADGKLEMGVGGEIADEAFTADSCRWWEYSAWLESRQASDQRKAPAPYDKQIVRAWGIKENINVLDPLNSDHLASVHSLQIPKELISRTIQTYRYIFWRLTGYRIETYLGTKMGVHVKDEPRKIAIVCGSESDLPVVTSVASRQLGPCFAKITVHVMSCHRNPDEVQNFAKEGCDGADVIIGVGSKALALPGILDSWLHAYGKEIPVIGVALGEKNSQALEAAVLSIVELPSSPVLTDELVGQCYQGEEGLNRAIERAVNGELPPPKSRVSKPVQMEVFKNF